MEVSGHSPLVDPIARAWTSKPVVPAAGDEKNAWMISYADGNEWVEVFSLLSRHLTEPHVPWRTCQRTGNTMLLLVISRRPQIRRDQSIKI